MALQTKTYYTLLCVLIIVSFNCSKKAADIPDADQYFTWDLDGNQGALLSPNDSLASARYSTGTHLIGMSTTNHDQLEIIFQGDRTTGMFTSTFADTYLNNKRRWAPTKASILIKVTQYGNIGGYIVGSYSGTLTDSTSISQTIKGNFRLKSR